MKQFLQKSMVTRSLSLLVAFFMMSAVGGTAQIQSSGSGASGGSSAGKTISLPVSSIDLKQPSVAKKSGKALPATRNNPIGNVIKIGQTEYADWESAIKELKTGDEMVLLQNLELDATRATLPTVACTISGKTGKEVLGYKETGERKTLLMKAPLTFKKIILDIDDIMASGYPLVLDEGTDISEFMKSDEASFRIWGGAYDKDVASTSITVKAGTYDYIYGGSAKYKVTGKTTVDIQGGTVNWIFGGGMSAGSTVGQTDVTISGGNIQSICAGGMNGDVEKDTRLTVMDNAFIQYTLGGGFSGIVGGTCHTTVEGGEIIGYLYGGGYELSATCANTEVIVNAGTIGHVENGFRFNLMGGGYEAPVTGKAKVTLNGGQFDCFVTAGGGQNDITTATCGSTELNITGGNFTKWTYGGGWASPVLGTATVKVNGTAQLTTLCGGGARPTASCGNTDVQINSNVNGWLFGGGEVGAVSGTAKVMLTNGTIANNIYGGCTAAACNRTEVIISGGQAIGVFGGGEGSGSVVNEANLFVSGGTFDDVYGSGFINIQANPQPDGYVKNVNMLITGGTIDYLSITPTITDATPTPVTGSMHLTIEGNKAIIGSTISKNCHTSDKDAKDAVLTFKDCGTQSAPYETPCLDGFTEINLVNSVVKPIKRDPYAGGEIYAYTNAPFSINGEGLIGNDMTVVYNSFIAPTMGNPLFSMDNIPTGMTFKMLVGNPLGTHTIYPTFKAGNYIFPAQTAADNKLTLYKIGITSPQNGVLSAKWNNIDLEDADQVPNNEEITIEAIPDAGYSLDKLFNASSELLDNPCIMAITKDVQLSASFIAVPYTVTIIPLTNGSITASPNTDVTIGTEIALTITPASGYRLKSGSLKVYKTGDESTTVNVINNTFSMPAYDVTVAAEFEEIPAPPTPPAPVYHTVTLPAVEGASTDPIAGDHEVESWDNFLFFLTLDKAYDQSEPVVTTDRGETITPRAKDGAYIIKYVRQPIVIMIDGIVKNPDPTANAEIQSGIKVWQNNRQLFIHTDKVEQVAIYTFGGQLKKKFRSTGGDELVQLPTGSYIVCIGDQRFKVVL